MQLKSLTLNKLPARFGSLERPRQCSAQRDKWAVFATDSTFLAVAKVFNNLDRLKIDNPPHFTASFARFRVPLGNSGSHGRHSRGKGAGCGSVAGLQRRTEAGRGWWRLNG